MVAVSKSYAKEMPGKSENGGGRYVREASHYCSRFKSLATNGGFGGEREGQRPRTGDM